MPLSQPHLGERAREMLLAAFDANAIASQGPDGAAFEGELGQRLGGLHVVALASGTAALHLGLRLLGVERDDEVLVSTLTFAASAFAVRYQGAHPVFIDSEERSWNMDPALLAQELESCARGGRIPRAVVVVDLYGQCADYQAISEVCERHRVPIIEDAAEALGASYRGRPAGSFGRAGVLSFNGNKIITTGSGGALATRDAGLADLARKLAHQAREPAIHYEHEHIGFNYRMPNLLAALGRAQLAALDQRVAARRAHRAAYVAALGDLPGLSFMPEAPGCRSSFWLTCMLIDPQRFGRDREALRLALEARNIEARPVWKPMHLQPVFRGCRARGGRVAESLFERGLCLPSGSDLSEGDRGRVIETLRALAGR